VCTRGSDWAPARGPSTSPLDGAVDVQAHLLSELQRVFPPIIVPERAAPHVCPECDEISQALASRAWLEIPRDFLSRSSGVLPLLSETAYVAYLPAWLREGLLSPDDGVAASLVVNLRSDPPVERFTSEQARVILALAKTMIAANMWPDDDPTDRESLDGIERTWAPRAV